MRVTDFVLGGTSTEEHPKSEKIGLLANKATMFLSPQILQLDILN